jgi:hypothetical protein
MVRLAEIGGQDEKPHSMVSDWLKGHLGTVPGVFEVLH